MASSFLLNEISRSCRTARVWLWQRGRTVVRSAGDTSSMTSFVLININMALDHVFVVAIAASYAPSDDSCYDQTSDTRYVASRSTALPAHEPLKSRPYCSSYAPKQCSHAHVLHACFRNDRAGVMDRVCVWASARSMRAACLPCEVAAASVWCYITVSLWSSLYIT